MRKRWSLFLLLVLLAATTSVALAQGYSWRGHARPFNFLFGNHIDAHQQTKTVGRNQLQGFLYISATGETVDGVPEATHADCDAQPETCTVGWLLHGIAMEATYVGHEEGMHPTWCVDPDDLPAQGGYSHFHWLGAPAHPTGGGHGEGDGLVPGERYAGYLLKLTAVDSFFFQHHGGYLVTPGIDTVTHANVITDCE